MHLPIQFPSDADVIVEEVTRFRALSAEDRMSSIHSLLVGGAELLRRSPKADYLQAYTLEQERLNQQAFREAVDRYGNFETPGE